MVHLAGSFILGLLQSLFPLTHPVVFAVVMDHSVTGVCRQDVLPKVLAGNCLPVRHLELWPLCVSLQLGPQDVVKTGPVQTTSSLRLVDFNLEQEFSIIILQSLDIFHG